MSSATAKVRFSAGYRTLTQQAERRIRERGAQETRRLGKFGGGGEPDSGGSEPSGSSAVQPSGNASSSNSSSGEGSSGSSSSRSGSGNTSDEMKADQVGQRQDEQVGDKQAQKGMKDGESQTRKRSRAKYCALKAITMSSKTRTERKCACISTKRPR